MTTSSRAAVSRAHGHAQERPPRRARDLDLRLQRILGLDDEGRSSLGRALAISEGLAPTAAEALVSAELLTRRELDALIPLRTLSHRRARKQRLNKDESDAVVRAARAALLAQQVFGDEARAGRWLRSPKKTFHGRTPLQMLDSSEGARLVEDALIRIDEGYFA